ncbi:MULTISPECIES: LysR family transcriptional regulator [unclassified Janthinobacterium]|uniref:LysR family transcriptional regulator n=1 Tax=unclassified Janthinobacterium TaxID=2610881 RepID=UPI001618A91E|nr:MULTISPECIES: LysR family transcriptional regulator [unclassified Janthinobacterium]MBB5609287.1 DNA-binding transcriptional LysR family regulator [Janthinobacterium sp. S3T4]MBB5614460.1 DNA-binding transcriptional LysR family regulator [Janthinobacterium sp. S3M3]
MNTRFLETFVVLAQLRSFRATARALHATPAAISLRIKTLEEELQTELIDRQSKEFRLTANAEYLLGHAKAVVDATRRLQAAAHKDSAVRGRLRLGVIESVVHSWLAQYIRELNVLYPEMEVDLTVDMSNLLERRLRASELDLVIQVEGVESKEIVSQALAAYPLHWIARNGLVDPRKEGLHQRLLQLPILTFGRGTAPQRAVEEILGKMANLAMVPLEQTRITCSPSVAAIVQLVKDGYGVAAIPSLFVASQLDSGEFVKLPVQPEPPSIIVSMCWHSNAEMLVHAAANAARQACARYCAQVDPRYIKSLG